MACLLYHWNKNHNTLLCERKSPANQNVVHYIILSMLFDVIINLLTLPVNKSNISKLFCLYVCTNDCGITIKDILQTENVYYIFIIFFYLIF